LVCGGRFPTYFGRCLDGCGWNLGKLLNEVNLAIVIGDMGYRGPCLIMTANFKTVEELDKIIGAAIIKGFHRAADNVLIFGIVIMVVLVSSGCQITRC